MVRLSTAGRLILTCSALRSMLDRRISIASSTTLPHWYPPSGVIFAKIMVSHFTTRDDNLTRVLFLKCSSVLTPRSPTDPTRYSIIHDIYQCSESAESSSVPKKDYLILSAEYRFTYPESPYSSPRTLPGFSPPPNLGASTPSDSTVEDLEGLGAYLHARAGKPTQQSGALTPDELRVEEPKSLITTGPMQVRP